LIAITAQRSKLRVPNNNQNRNQSLGTLIQRQHIAGQATAKATHRSSLKTYLHNIAVAHVGHYLLFQHRVLHVDLGIRVLQQFFLLHDLTQLLLPSS
jgi:hypothetical protein